MTYMVSFQYANGIYCTNIAIGTREAVEKKYFNYPWYSIREATEDEIRTAKRKRMPFVDC